jgi:hypothetical protein
VRGFLLIQKKFPGCQTTGERKMKTMNILATAQAEHNLTTAPACAKELILSAIRSAVIRAKLDANELSTIGVALSGDMIGPDDALSWLADIGLITQVTRAE